MYANVFCMHSRWFQAERALSMPIKKLCTIFIRHTHTHVDSQSQRDAYVVVDETQYTIHIHIHIHIHALPIFNFVYSNLKVKFIIGSLTNK